MASQIYNNMDDTVMENTVTIQPTALKPSLVKTRVCIRKRWLKYGGVEKPQTFM